MGATAEHMGWGAKRVGPGKRFLLLLVFMSIRHAGGRSSRRIRRPQRSETTQPEPRIFSQTGAAIESVAVCFNGQFVRHQMLDTDIRSKFGGSKNVSYSAFISTSTSHSETDPSDVVDGASLCSSLLALGFEHCHADLVPYDPQVFASSSKSLEFQSRNGVFPFRTASLFSTVSRCATSVLQVERNGSSSSSSSLFDAIVMTRLDVINGISVVHHRGAGDWLFAPALAEFDLVGLKKVPGLVDDRFFFGRRNALVQFESLYPAFSTLYSPTSNSPERMLHAFVTRNIQGLRLGPLARFVSVDSFAVNNDKYSLGFKRSIEQQLGLRQGVANVGKGGNNLDNMSAESKKKACAHIKTPLAHNKCLGG